MREKRIKNKTPQLLFSNLRLHFYWLIAGLVLIILLPAGRGQSSQPPERVYKEARTVYLDNLARRQNGVAPLRWNRQLTAAARWFSWDSVENRPGGSAGSRIPWGTGLIGERISMDI